ncbi:hypothetical protein SARC_02291 [Sphaeroforma arctica JP610]|uniref:Uncharacterized protein n=1 Tax=Sphaeroforma arctica JP610 TaxID=667725 RepID=A0A0L0G956_9EUKA|nr:hypothetical protein SARC_02291 [Sphaeroforma arctica JP610]KNC85530.1 hypothetical protein SARC_02291 [Sphaeroforma arctica JP610]|eukprot:XP_014159432.1 hypothetical protein SARC_02291 [Sphaeroforma arctica JP610]
MIPKLVSILAIFAAVALGDEISAHLTEAEKLEKLAADERLSVPPTSLTGRARLNYGKDYETCYFKGNWYNEGDRRGFESGYCKCKSNGKWVCQFEPDGCEYDGEVYDDGDTVRCEGRDCKEFSTCTCKDGELEYCKKPEQLKCHYDDRKYSHGDWIVCSGRDCKDWSKCKCNDGELEQCKEPIMLTCYYEKYEYESGKTVYCEGHDCKYWSHCHCDDGDLVQCKEPVKPKPQKCHYNHRSYSNGDMVRCDGYDCKEWSECRCAHGKLVDCEKEWKPKPQPKPQPPKPQPKPQPPKPQPPKPQPPIDPTGNYYVCGDLENTKCHGRGFKHNTPCCRYSTKCPGYSVIKCNTSECCL